MDDDDYVMRLIYGKQPTWSDGMIQGCRPVGQKFRLVPTIEFNFINIGLLLYLLKPHRLDKGRMVDISIKA